MVKKLTGFLLFLVICILVRFAVASPPGDLKMIEEFENSKDTFTAIVKLKQEDVGVDSIHFNQISEYMNISESNKRQYVELMERINIRSLLTDNHRIIFIPRKSLFNLTETKGYVYSETELQPLYQSLDDAQPKTDPYIYIYKKINTDWYLFYINSN